jgi:FkbM family methyltransferase
MIRAHRLARLLPLGVGITGRRRDALFALFDALFGKAGGIEAIDTAWGRLTLDRSHPPERLLSYLFDNVVRHYATSELGRYIARVAAPGATFVDVGANLGMYALVARRHGFSTVVVEPEPRHGAFLARNAAAYGKVLALALSDRPGALPLYYQADNPGATSLVPCPSYVKSERLVPVRTFAALAAAGEFGELRAVRLVKIDVEGLEAAVVAGMCGALATGWRPDIWCEVRGDRSGRNGGSYREVRATLAAFGYRARELDHGRDLALDEAELSRRTVFDLLFTPLAA